MTNLLDQINDLPLEDQTETPQGFTYEPPAAGKAMARFVGYIELGKREQKEGQFGKKDPEYSVLLCFELNGKKHMKEYGEGDDKQIRPTLIYEEMTLKMGDKANFKKLFNKMRGAREDVKHMAQLLGSAYIITIVHNTVKGKDGKADRVYANMRDNDGSWLIGPPTVEDPMSGEVTTVPVPEAKTPIRLLLWKTPTKEQWDSLYVDGERTVKDKDGNEKVISNNVMQQRIVKNAVDYEGSALQELIEGLGGLTLDDDEPEQQQDQTDDEPGDVLDDEIPGDYSGESKQEEKPAEKPKQDTAEKPAEKPAEKAPSKSTDDVFAELGLD